MSFIPKPSDFKCKLPVPRSSIIEFTLSWCIFKSLLLPSVIVSLSPSITPSTVKLPAIVWLQLLLITVPSTAKLLEAVISPPPDSPSPAVNVTPLWSICSFATNPLRLSWTIWLSSVVSVILALPKFAPPVWPPLKPVPGAIVLPCKVVIFVFVYFS